MTDTFIFDAVRTPRGKGHKHGALYEVKPIDLLAALLRALHSRHQFKTTEISDLLIGCVNPVDDQGSNIARAALLYAGWDQQVSGLQINRQEASGLEAINLAAMNISMGLDQLLVAGGIECMSRIPRRSDGGPINYDVELLNTINHIPQGVAADLLATLEGFDRTQLDKFALQSRQRALQAQKNGYFEKTLIPVFDRNGLVVLEKEELLEDLIQPEDLEQLPPAYLTAGQLGYDDMALHRYPEVEKIMHNHTLASTAMPADGAALLLLGNEARGKALGLRPRAKILASAVVSVDATLQYSGPSLAAEKALKFSGMKPKDVQLWECNEDFAAIPLKLLADFNIDASKLNPNGGALALGHPLGASGAMLLSSLLDELERCQLSTGIATMATGGGMAVATIIEKV